MSMPVEKRRKIGILVDRSGSMQSIRKDTEGGLTAFLDQQKEADWKLAAEGTTNETHVYLAQFDDEYERVYGPVPLFEHPVYELVPRGGTALYDALMRMIEDIELGKSWMLHKADHDDVTIMVFTDGGENASTKTTAAALKAKIEEKQAQGWTILFVGSNQDAVLEGAKIGICRDHAITYSTENAASALRSVGASVSMSYVSGTSVAFTDAQRSEVQ